MAFIIYKYYPCPGSSGTVFTSNTENPGSPAFGGGNITFPNLKPGECYHIVVEGPEVNPIPYTNEIDWPTEPYIFYPTCEDCVEGLNTVFPCVCTTVQNVTLSRQNYKYIDCFGIDGGIVLDPGETSEKLCISQWDFDPPLGFTQFYGDCINDECPSFYLLTDCSDNTNTFCSNSTSLDPYADNEIAVTLFGEAYTGKCWTITTITECETPVSVTVNQIFPEGCLDCLNQFVINYELVNCEDGSIIYTSTDLSEYVEQVVQLEVYGNECWFVRVLDSQIPSDTTVNVSESFATCPECTSSYFLLEDCNTLSSTEPIVTITDLSQYVGQVITLSTCPEICWTVSETDYSPDYQVVNVESDFEDCDECALSKPALCTSFTNSTDAALSVTTIDSTLKFEKITIAAKETTVKGCYYSWEADPGIIVNSFGECVNGECSPEPVRPKRKVTPGYDTPVCSTEYYEKVVCNFSEWMYKDVLQKRYGISNCCPEDLLKWQIKYEMLMLDILVNPDYECTTTTSCCGPTISLNYSRDCNS
jgi:hypothetical protein